MTYTATSHQGAIQMVCGALMLSIFIQSLVKTHASLHQVKFIYLNLTQDAFLIINY